jgi:hypothetical protein
MRFPLVVVAALALVPTAAAWPDAHLKVTVWPKGKSGPSSTWTLRCDPLPGGTHPTPIKACRALSRSPKALRPVPKNTACTEQWDGPQVALVRGTHTGHRVRAWFKRTDGCEIGRWNALKALFPISG